LVAAVVRQEATALQVAAAHQVQVAVVMVVDAQADTIKKIL